MSSLRKSKKAGASPRPEGSSPLPTRDPVKPIDLSRLKTYPLSRRQSKVQVSDFSGPWKRGGSLKQFLDSLPDILAVTTLRQVAQAVVRAHSRSRPVIVGMGAHVVKVGLSPIIVDLMERGIVTAVAMNGAVIIHDFELALMGQTSEEVDAEIDSGRFGMAEETGRMLNEAIVRGAKDGQGIGEAVGHYINRYKGQFRHRATSILATGARLGIPVTVHVALGTDIIHMHPSADGAAIGAGSLLDFRKLAAVVAEMEGGVYLNLGSAVILPEVFLKTVTLGRNLGNPLSDITTVNMDFLPHYRAATNVIKRPTQKGGHGYQLTGHHEIMVPLLAAAVLEELRR
jgi:deoxyhypusine synthase